ncbi:MAG: peptidylprolyl isomerase [Phycisphaerales bacterium]
MPRAVASHILVPTEAKANEIKSEIDSGQDFGAMAKKHSTCPSGRSGGSLGEFGPGDMVPEFDRVIFSDLPIGKVSEPVKTQFGYHLIRVDMRRA